MVTIYDMQSGTIVSENEGVTTVDAHTDVPEYILSLQPVVMKPEAAHSDQSPCAEYMALIRELLRDM